MNSTINKLLIRISENTISIKKNYIFIRTGQLNNKIGLVKKGILRGFLTTEGGKDVNLFFYQENDLFSGNFVPNSRASINIQALEDSIIIIGDFKKIIKLIAEDENVNNINTVPLNSKIVL